MLRAHRRGTSWWRASLDLETGSVARRAGDARRGLRASTAARCARCSGRAGGMLSSAPASSRARSRRWRSALDFEVICLRPARGIPPDLGRARHDLQQGDARRPGARAAARPAHARSSRVTHDPKLDDLALLEALKSPAFYVGALGSRGNTAKRKERLALFDLSAAEIARLHGPIGLDIGSRTPAEIAVSILAEIVAVRNGVALKQKKPVAAAARRQRATRRGRDPLAARAGTTRCPDAELALGPRRARRPGLLAAGGELTPRRLAEAYRKGIFPWYSDGQPVLWWSPDPRMVLLLGRVQAVALAAQDAARASSRTPGCEVRIDSAFDARDRAPAPQRRATARRGTWIVPEMVDAYSACTTPAACTASRPGSTASWPAASTASASAACSSASRCSRAAPTPRRSRWRRWSAFCRAHGIELIDCQQHTAPPGLARRAARSPRAEFEARLAHGAGEAPPVRDWTYDLRLWRAARTRGAAAARGRRAA